MQTPPVHVHRTLRRDTLAVSELKSSVGAPEPSAPLGYDDAYLFAVQFRSFRREMWLNGRSVRCDPVQTGMTYVYDLKQDPRAYVQGPAHALTFYIPRAALNACAEQADMPAITELSQASAVGLPDPVMRHLGGAALATFASPHKASPLLLDGILAAACAHVLGHYGTSQRPANDRGCGLAPWQERRAREMMSERLDVSLSELARECGISVSQFGRAFKRSTGISPHQWQLARRIDKAQALLADTDLEIAEIALACGFSNQSHLTRTFTETVGIAPARWKRRQSE